MRPQRVGDGVRPAVVRRAPAARCSSAATACDAAPPPSYTRIDRLDVGLGGRHQRQPVGDRAGHGVLVRQDHAVGRIAQFDRADQAASGCAARVAHLVDVQRGVVVDPQVAGLDPALAAGRRPPGRRPRPASASGRITATALSGSAASNAARCSASITSYGGHSSGPAAGRRRRGAAPGRVAAAGRVGCRARWRSRGPIVSSTSRAMCAPGGRIDTMRATLTASRRPLATSYDVALLDLDGVVYVGRDAVPGAPQALAAARAGGHAPGLRDQQRRAAAGRRRRAPDGRWRSPAEPDEVITSSQAAAHYLADRLPSGAKVLVVGTTGLIEALRERGLQPVSSRRRRTPRRSCRVTHPSCTGSSWPKARSRSVRGALWVATNLDPTVPSPRGPLPGNGSLVAALRHATGVDSGGDGQAGSDDAPRVGAALGCAVADRRGGPARHRHRRRRGGRVPEPARAQRRDDGARAAGGGARASAGLPGHRRWPGC